MLNSFATLRRFRWVVPLVLVALLAAGTIAAPWAARALVARGVERALGAGAGGTAVQVSVGRVEASRPLGRILCHDMEIRLEPSGPAAPTVTVRIERVDAGFLGGDVLGDGPPGPPERFSLEGLSFHVEPALGAPGALLGRLAAFAATVTAEAGTGLLRVEATLRDLEVVEAGVTQTALGSGQVVLRVPRSLAARGGPDGREGGPSATAASTTTTARIDVERVDLVGPRLRIVRSADGRVRLLGRALPDRPEGAPSAADRAHVLLRRARIRGGALELRDEAVPAPYPPFVASIEAIDALAVNLTPASLAALAQPASGDAPRPAAAGAGPASVAVTARAPGLFQSARLDLLLGEAGASGAAPGRVTASVTGLRLPSLSGPLAGASRVAFARGTASLEGRLDLTPYRATGQARLLSSDVLLGGPGHVSRSVGLAAPVSLERALSMLADAEGRIDLAVPISLDRRHGALDVAEALGGALLDAVARSVVRVGK